MFKVKGEDLQFIVEKVTKSAKRARLSESHVFVSSKQKGEVNFFFSGEDLQIQKVIECESEGDFEFASTVYELERKVLALPSDELIHVNKNGNNLSLNWGRSSKIAMEVIPELSPGIEIPEAQQSVVWAPGELHKIARTMPHFTAIKNSNSDKKCPVTRGLNFIKEETGEVLVRATNSARAVTYQPLGIEWFEDFAAAIPTETISALNEIVPNDVEVKVSVNNEQTLVIFEAGRLKAVSRLLGGEYPAIDTAYTLPADAKAIWRVDRMELLNTARRIRHLSNDKPVMSFNKEGTKTFVSLQGVLVEQIGAMVEGDEDLDFATNANDMEICLNLYRCEEVLICLRGVELPITVVGEEEEATANEKIKSLISQIKYK